MIKVGQVYKTEFIPSVKVISYIDDDFDEVSIIDSDGFVDRWKFDDFENCKWKLLAEYPTWEEAVNSKEFKE